MKTKAISPLIATVLLVGFTIVIAGLLFAWASGFFTEGEEESCEIQAERICISYIEIVIQDINCCDENKLTFSILNNGQYSLNKFNIWVDDGFFTTEEGDYTPNVAHPITIIGVTSLLDKIKVMPILIHHDSQGNECEVACKEETAEYSPEN